MQRLPIPPLRLKSPSKASLTPVKPRVGGQLLATRQIIKREKDQTEAVVQEHNRSVQLDQADGPEFTGITGINLGITIPGPDRSYMSGRIDVFGYVPATPDDAGMHAGWRRISDLAQAELEIEVEETKEALGLK